MKICAKCKQEKEDESFRVRSDRKKTGGKHSYCKECVVDLVSLRRVQTKIKCIEYKGGECSICGYKKCYSAMEFHHLDSSKKDFQINRSATLSFEKLKTELDKCVLLCANCHREIHSKSD